MSDADPRCPECGEPIGRTATYCMHCSADLTDERAAADADHDGNWDGSAPDDGGGGSDVLGVGTGPDGPYLDPDGLVDDSLTVAVGIGGGLLVGVVATAVLLVMTGSAWGVLAGVVAWLVSTAYLVRRRTVQGAVATSGYAVAAVLLLVPFVAFSPVADVDGGVSGRVALFLFSLLVLAVPAGFAAGLGYVASRFVPEDAAEAST